MKYYFGIYVEYTNPDRPRIAQLALTVDDLSCEMLAYPGLITFYSNDRMAAKSQAKEFAKIHGCKFIEFEWRNTQLIKIKR